MTPLWLVFAAGVFISGVLAWIWWEDRKQKRDTERFLELIEKLKGQEDLIDGINQGLADLYHEAQDKAEEER